MPAQRLSRGAIDVSASGFFTADLTYAHDDDDQTGPSGSCGYTGGRDVFCELTLTGAQVLYADTEPPRVPGDSVC